MTDRELLELAAKAAGLELDWDVPDGASPWVITGEGSDRGPAAPWDPLEDDGDAFRLAVDLHIDVVYDRANAETWTAFMIGDAGYNTHESWGPLRDGSQDDQYRATRRAIALAAAEIGASK